MFLMAGPDIAPDLLQRFQLSVYFVLVLVYVPYRHPCGIEHIIPCLPYELVRLFLHLPLVPEGALPFPPSQRAFIQIGHFISS